MSSDTYINMGFANRWSPFNQLNKLIGDAIRSKSSECAYELESALQKHRTDFLSILKNPPRNALHKEIVSNASKDGITVIQQQNRNKTVIPQLMVDESLLMSEMFELNELYSLELIIAGECQEPRYPGMSRGPIAVQLYYDGRKNLLNSLQLLIDAKSGRTWNVKLNNDISRIINKFTDDLKEDGIIIECIEQLSSFDMNGEYDMLQRNRALGSAKYQKMIWNLLKENRKRLADIIFSYSAQCDLNKNETIKLMALLSKGAELDSSALMDSVSTSLLMALMYVLDVSILQTCEETDDRVLQLPLIKHRGLLNEIFKRINDFNVPEIKAILYFCCGISSKILSSFPLNEMIDEDSEVLINNAIELNVFNAFYKLLNDTMHNEEFFMRQIHTLICDFIIVMPLKMKELREKGDEMSRLIMVYISEGIHPPDHFPRNFEKFLRFAAQLYSRDKFHFSDDFWISSDDKEMNNRKQTLFKFIRSLSDSYFSSVLHIPIIKFLTSLAQNSPFNVFNLIKSISIHQSSQLSFDKFVESLNQYYSNIRDQNKENPEVFKGAESSTFYLPRQTQLSNIDAHEICAYLELIETIAKKDRTCCLALAENQQYSFILTLIGIVRSAVAKSIKSSIFNCLSGFAFSSSSVAVTIWTQLDPIMPKLSYTNPSGGPFYNQLFQSGIAVEIEDIETKNEEYPLTLGFLKLIKSIFSHICSNPSHRHFSTESCLNYILNSIMLKINSRAFKYVEEKWEMILNCFEIIYICIENYSPLVDGPEFKSAFTILSQVLQESNLFRFIIWTLEVIAENYESDITSLDPQSNKDKSIQIKECASYGLKILSCICEKQNDFISVLHDIPRFPLPMIVKLEQMFLNINPKTASPDRLTILVRLMFVSNDIANEAIHLLNILSQQTSDIPFKILMQLHSCSKQISGDNLINLFVESLESSSKELRISSLSLILTCLDYSHILPSYNFAHTILGFDKKFAINDPGVLGQTYSCFHSILRYFDSTSDLEDNLEERRLSMKILNKLCTAPSTSENVLRFLRTSFDFMLQYLQIWDKKYLNNNYFSVDFIIPEFASFLKILTLELKMTAQQNLKSYCTAYTNFLLTDSKRKRIIQMLTPDLFEHMHPSMPNWKYFELNEFLKTEFSNCGSSIDIKTLHQRLINDMKFSAPQLGVVETKAVQEEIKAILKYANVLNESHNKLVVKVSFFESWRELIETIISVNAFEHFNKDQRIRILFEINHEMIHRLALHSLTPSLLIPISSVILLLSSASYGISNVSSANLMACIKSIVNSLDSSSTIIWNQQKRTRVYLYASLLYLIRGLPYGFGDTLRLSSRLVEKLCKDILSGHEITKVLATFLLTESDLSWINDIASNGTLKLLMDSLLSDDREIRANKCELTKIFFAFDAKMFLFLRICSYSNGIQLLINLDIIGTLASLQCFEMYPYLIGVNPVCHKIFVNILRLLLMISTTSFNPSVEEIGQFVASRSTLFSDVFRIASTLNTPESKEVLLIATKLVARYISYANQSLQRNFINLLPQFCDANNDSVEIVCNILYGSLQLSRIKGVTPIFAPTLLRQYSDMNFGPLPLGLIVLIINNACTKWSNSKFALMTIDYALYLLWHHFNLYMVLLNLSNEEANDVEIMKSQCYELGDVFNKVETVIQGNTFTGALIRRMKRIIYSKK